MQVNKTDSIRRNGLPTVRLQQQTDSRGNIIGTEAVFGLPTAVKLNYVVSSASDMGDNEVFIIQSSTNGLPSSLAGCSKATLHSIAESADFTINITEDLRGQMGSNNFFSKIGSCVSKSVQQKVVDLQKSGLSSTEAMQCLMPDAVYQNRKPLVEWAVTITPMMMWRASPGRADAFWAYYDSMTGEMKVVMPSSMKKEAVLIMDAYYSASYNTSTLGSSKDKSIWFQSQFRDAIKQANGYIPASTIDDYWTLGVLRRWYTSSSGMNILKDLGRCAYIDEPGPICGIDDWLNPSTYSDAEIGHYGGLILNILEKEDTSIPVYYYITPDPDDPILPPGSATPPTFKPEPPEGTTVKKVVIPDKPLPNTSSENPPQDFPDDQPAVPKNPDGSYPIEPDDPPYILVECEQTEIPVYFHTFTFTNTDTSKQYKDVFEYLKDNKGIGESSATETIVCKETLPTLADNKTAQYKPAGASVIVDALSTSTTSTGDPWKSIADQISVQCNRNPSVCYYYATEYTERRDPMSKALGNKSVTYSGKTASKSATRSIHVRLFHTVSL